MVDIDVTRNQHRLEVVGLTVVEQRPLRFSRRKNRKTIISDISFHVDSGATVGVIGKTGVGKSTVAKAICRLIPIQKGEVFLDGENLITAPNGRLRQLRKRIQLVLQNPALAMNPRHRVQRIIAEPLTNYDVSSVEREAKVKSVLAKVELDPEMLSRYPYQLSGGQKQRVAIARAMILEPDVVIFDEPVSSLDRVVQRKVLDNLLSLQAERSITYVIITHDEAVARYCCDEVLVMDSGSVVDRGSTEGILNNLADGQV